MGSVALAIVSAQIQDIYGNTVIGGQSSDSITYNIQPLILSSPTPALWFDAADASTITASGATLSSWQNKGSANVGGGTSNSSAETFVQTGVRTLSEKNVISFPAGVGLLTQDPVSLASQALYVFSVFKALTPNNTVGLFNEWVHGGLNLYLDYVGWPSTFWGGPSGVSVNWSGWNVPDPTVKFSI